MLAGACATVPITGRKQMKLLPNATLNQMANQEYQTFLSKHPLCTDATKVAQVKRVGERIQKAVTNYFTVNKKTKYLAGYQWVFNLVEDPYEKTDLSAHRPGTLKALRQRYDVLAPPAVQPKTVNP